MNSDIRKLAELVGGLHFRGEKWWRDIPINKIERFSFEFRPFTNIADAMLCLEKVKCQKYQFSKWTVPQDYACKIIGLDGEEYDGFGNNREQAICQAVLAAMEVKDG